MTTLQQELLNSREFCEKRMKEQKQYIEELSHRYCNGKISEERLFELYWSAAEIHNIFLRRLINEIL